MEEYTPKIIALPTGLDALLYGAPNHESECTLCHQQILLRKMELTKKTHEILKTIIEKFGGSVRPTDIRVSMGAVAYANYTSMKYWQIIEQAQIGDEYGWKVTEIGRRFYAGELLLPEILWVYNDVPRFVPVDLYGRWVSINDLRPAGEMSREIAASESIPLDSSSQTALL